MADKHTPTSWEFTGEFYNDHGGKYLQIVDGNGNEVLGEYGPFERDTATRIVRAVNRDHLFGELVEALKLVRKTCGGPENWNGETRRFLEVTDAILAKVEDEGHG